MLLDRARAYLEEADIIERNYRGWMLSCALSPNMKEQDQRRLWDDVRARKAKVYKPKTEAEAKEELRKKGLGK